MCSRFDQNGEVVTFSRKAGSNKWNTLLAKYNIGIGDKGLIYTPKMEIEEAVFGYVPKWQKEVKQLYYNARVEGKLNDTNDRHYQGSAGIFEMPSFRDAIKTSRCVVPVSAFYEGPETIGLAQPFLIYSSHEPVLYLAGIYGEHFDAKKNITVQRFSILTTSATDVTAAIGHHRCPVMLHEEMLEDWLDMDLDLKDVEAIMLQKWQPLGMVATAIVPAAMKQRNSPTPLPFAGNGLFN